MNEDFLYAITIKVAKVISFIEFQCQSGQLKVCSKNKLSNFIRLGRLKPTQKPLSQSNSTCEMKAMKSFILWH